MFPRVATMRECTAGRCTTTTKQVPVYGRVTQITTFNPCSGSRHFLKFALNTAGGGAGNGDQLGSMERGIMKGKRDLFMCKDEPDTV